MGRFAETPFIRPRSGSNPGPPCPANDHLGQEWKAAKKLFLPGKASSWSHNYGRWNKQRPVSQFVVSFETRGARDHSNKEIKLHDFFS
jgi:hypothetical protein